MVIKFEPQILNMIRIFIVLNELGRLISIIDIKQLCFDIK
jgi:hypothetical protein